MFSTFIAVLLHSQIGLTIWNSSIVLVQIFLHKGPVFISKHHTRPCNILFHPLCFEFYTVKSQQNRCEKELYSSRLCYNLRPSTSDKSDTFSFQQGRAVYLGVRLCLWETTSELRMDRAAQTQLGQARFIVGLIRREYK